MQQMTFKQRNNEVDDMLVKFKLLHDKYTSSRKLLTDEEWKEYIDSMDVICAEHKGTNLEMLAGKLCMAFLDDTEMLQKKLRELNEKS